MATLECENHPNEHPLTGTVTLKKSVEITYLKGYLPCQPNAEEGGEGKGRFPFVRTDRTDQSSHNPARSVKS